MGEKNPTVLDITSFSSRHPTPQTRAKKGQGNINLRKIYFLVAIATQRLRCMKTGRRGAISFWAVTVSHTGFTHALQVS